MPGTLVPAPKASSTRALREGLYALVERGHFGAARVEAIGGELVTGPPEGDAHDAAVERVALALRGLDAIGYDVQRDAYVEFGNGDALLPDVFVLGPDGEESLARLVVEVAGATLRRDRHTKSAIYALAGVPEYWIVNPRARQIEVRRDPSGTEYVSLSLVEEGETIAPLYAPEGELRAGSLLPAPDRAGSPRF